MLLTELVQRRLKDESSSYSIQLGRKFLYQAGLLKILDWKLKTWLVLISGIFSFFTVSVFSQRRHTFLSLQVVCGSKYIVRGESPRDHVDLLASSRHWPPVYVVDLATSVALCADICYPDLTSRMWGRNQGCFSDPMEPIKVSWFVLFSKLERIFVMSSE